MPKNSKTQMKEDEKKILKELLKNANLSVNEIADRLGFSRSKARRIIKNLEEDKTIWGYTAIIDKDKIGLKSYCILLKKASVKVKESDLDIVINRDLIDVAKADGVDLDSEYFFNGVYDGQIWVTAENVNQVKRFINDMNNLIGSEYLKATDILEVLLPLRERGFNNPNLKQLKDYFSL